MLQLWRISYRHLSYASRDRHEFTKIIAIMSRSQKDAVAFALKSFGSPEWQAENIITNADCIGELQAAEGFTVPQEED